MNEKGGNPGQFSLFDQEPTIRVGSAIDSDVIGDREIPAPKQDTATDTPVITAEQQAAIDRETAQLIAYKGLLTTFGSMNMGQNFRNRFSDSPVVVDAVFRRRYGNKLARQYEQSVEGSIGLEEKGRGQISAMLGLVALEDKGIISKDQAGAIRDATYDFYTDTYLGIDETKMKARKSELGKVGRRLKKLQKDD